MRNLRMGSDQPLPLLAYAVALRDGSCALIDSSREKCEELLLFVHESRCQQWSH